MTGFNSGSVKDQETGSHGIGGAAAIPRCFVPVDPDATAWLIAFGLFRPDAFLTTYHCP